MNEASPYEPLACSLYDRFEAAATLRRPLGVARPAADGSSAVHQVRILDLFTRSHAEYALLDNGETVRLDVLAAMAQLKEAR